MKKSKWHRIKKILIIIGCVILLLIIIWRLLFFINFSAPQPQQFGVTFSQKAAEELGLDWKKVYLASLEELNIKNYRLVAYWDKIEKDQGQYDFSDLSWQMDQSQKQNAKVILAIGRRVPRWPECHQPSWLNNLSEKQQQEALLNYINIVVKHYKTHPALEIWQVENEPYLKLFGQCPDVDKIFLKKEIAQVKEADPNHPTMVTDSGELATWIRTRNLADYLGTSVYRTVYNPRIGYTSYGPFIPASFYRLKAALVGKPADKLIVTEFQDEPWSPRALKDEPLSEQEKSMTLKKFNQNFEFAKKLDISRVYFWGVEWWYWMETQGHPEYWNAAKGMF